MRSHIPGCLYDLEKGGGMENYLQIPQEGLVLLKAKVIGCNCVDESFLIEDLKGLAIADPGNDVCKVLGLGVLEHEIQRYRKCLYRGRRGRGRCSCSPNRCTYHLDTRQNWAWGIFAWASSS